MEKTKRYNQVFLFKLQKNDNLQVKKSRFKLKPALYY